MSKMKRGSVIRWGGGGEVASSKVFHEGQINASSSSLAYAQS